MANVQMKLLNCATSAPVGFVDQILEIAAMRQEMELLAVMIPFAARLFAQSTHFVAIPYGMAPVQTKQQTSAATFAASLARGIST